jgi:hypothetical protein
MEPEGSLMCSQEPAPGPNLQPAESGPLLHAIMHVNTK